MTLKQKATSGFLWNTLEKLSIQLLGLATGIILARILEPEDFGLMAMLTIFTIIGETFVSSGMGSGLIQKQNKTDIDFSTVFVFNLGVALTVYLLIYAIAPYVSVFYSEPKLTDLLRVLTLNLIIGAFVSIQRIKLNIDLNFKTLSKVNVTSNLLSGGIAIFFAWYGIGYWALALKMILNRIFQLLLFLFLGNWSYSFAFSKNSFKELFGFGSKILFTSLYAKALKNIYNVLIGKYYTSSDLGYYSRALSFTELLAGTIHSVIHQVTYPILSQMRSDKNRMISIFSRLIKMSGFVIFPSMVLLSALAEPIVLLLLTEKWAPVIPLLQWMPFGRVFFPASALNLNLLNANGRSDLFLKVDLSKLPLSLIALLITLPISIEAMVIGHVLTSFIAFFFNTYMTGKLFNYGVLKQLKDMLPSIINSSIMWLSVFFIIFYIDNMFLKLSIGIVSGIFIYLLLSYFQKNDEFLEFRKIATNMVQKK